MSIIRSFFKENQRMINQLLKIIELSVSLKSSGQELLFIQNLEFKKGLITGIVGESGSGKSLTALSIMGLLADGLEFSKGNILFLDKALNQYVDLSIKTEIEKRRGIQIGMIFQEPMTSLNPSMPCGKQLDECLKIHTDLKPAERKKKIVHLLEKVKLSDPRKMYGSYPHQLSGGQRQRVMIAMALSTSPDLLIADEPTTALDVTVQKEIILLLKELQAEYQLTVIFITHDLRILSEIAQEIIVMRNGKIIEEGPVKKILNNPENPYTKALIACQPSPDKRPERLLTVEDFEAGTPKSYKERAKVISEIPLLTIRNLDLHYQPGLWSVNKEFHALKNIHLDIFKGECLGLVGESGCGKTSLGKTILGLIRSASGDIIYREKNLNSLNKRDLRKIRKNIQVVFQDPYSSLNPLFKINKMLLEARILHFPDEKKSERYAFIENLILKTGLKIRDLEKYPHEFSGGQRQRIGIARALVVEPEFLILDEAVSALDVSVQAQILNLLNDLKKEFTLSYLFISHDLSVVKYMSDRIVVMKEGEIVESGDSDEIYFHPKSDYTKLLVSSVQG